jgi:hypothetical protein
MSNPVCKVCGGTGNGVTFNLFPKVPGQKFGDICVPCEAAVLAVEAAKAVG